MNLEGIMLNEISQAEKYKYCVIFLIDEIKKKKTEYLNKQNRT